MEARFCSIICNFLIFFILINFVFFSGCIESNDGNGINNEGDKTSDGSDEFLDSDNDGVNDNIDWAPYDPREQYDSDNDSIGDNADIYDNGNGGIRVNIEYYEDDNSSDQTLSPFFEIQIIKRDRNGSSYGYGYNVSSVFLDARVLFNPFSYCLDVEDDVDSVFVVIVARCDDIGEFGEFIDLSKKSSDSSCCVYFNPGITSSQSFSDDGKLDYIENELDALIEYTVEVVGI